MSDNKIYITLDYELFFGRSTGSVQKSVIEPTARLRDIARRHRVAFTFFVDAGMLRAMKNNSHEPRVAEEYQLVADQLRALRTEGHSLQLHVHPHWEDMRYENGQWQTDMSRYRLDQFSDSDIARIFREYKAALVEVVGGDVHAFRAGGWCIQPFHRIKAALQANGIRLDSTLYRDGYMNTVTHKFDFRGMPAAPSWRFDDDPLRPTADGWITEIPISTTKYSPWFYMMMTFHRLIKNPEYRFVGDGAAIGGGRMGTLKLVLTGGEGVVSLDGFRARRLNSSFKEYSARQRNGNFVAIGHPKAFCERTFRNVEKLAKSHAANFAVM